ncbi:LacI family transcriptional regulator [Martelella alba]|uniref:LacI family transcriptional regulator n=1 Tax=Martelella alba TaxID=2590451 RepID=A0A506U519_9HYPH|nr:LacI family DNA-binding transcriptional regulator [Martelella alba]TPW28281.1 LacI family transcriptional regulator [Martelella alba]
MSETDLNAHSFDQVVRVWRGSGNGPVSAKNGRPPDIKEVARLAGVSPVTVSRALRQPDIVSQKTRERILSVVRETGYASNPHAVALRSGRSTIVAAFVSNLLSQQYSQAVRACARVLEAEGYQLMVGQTSYSYAMEQTAIRSLIALRPAAVFFTGVIELEEHRQQLSELDIPVVESWAYPRDPLDMLVGISNTDGGRMAAEHLVEKGYRRLAYLGRSGGRGSLRLKGFQARAQELGADIVRTFSIDGIATIHDGRQACRRILDEPRDFDAVFCANDLLGTGMLLEARQRGVRVPDELAILSFGHNDLAGELTPRLTTISFDVDHLGGRAAELIIARLSGGENTSAPRECLDLQLHAGEST